MLFRSPACESVRHLPPGHDDPAGPGTVSGLSRVHQEGGRDPAPSCLALLRAGAASLTEAQGGESRAPCPRSSTVQDASGAVGQLSTGLHGRRAAGATPTRRPDRPRPGPALPCTPAGPAAADSPRPPAPRRSSGSTRPARAEA